MNKSSGHKHDGTTSEGPKIATLSSPVTGDLTFSGNVTFSNAITVPETPISDTDAASKGYVDSALKIFQVVNITEQDVKTGTTAIPQDDSKPEITEGTEVMKLAITPTSTSNYLKVDVVCQVGHSYGSSIDMIAGALFNTDMDSTYAIAVGYQECAAERGGCLAFTYYVLAPSISETTFYVRIGMYEGQTVYLNGGANQAGRVYGGAACSSITITEIAA